MGSGQAPDTPDGPGIHDWFVDHYDGLLKVAWFATRDRSLAEDIAQDASERIIKAWSNPAKREAIVSSPSYVRTIVVNAFRSHLKNPSRTNAREVALEAQDERHRTNAADLELRMAILELPEAQLTLLLLRYEGCTIVKAGALLGLTRDQAYELNKKAERSLAELLKH